MLYLDNCITIIFYKYWLVYYKRRDTRYCAYNRKSGETARVWKRSRALPNCARADKGFNLSITTFATYRAERAN